MNTMSGTVEDVYVSEAASAAATVSGVSWGAVLAGAAAAAALSLVLLILGVGLGLSVSSPWSASAEAIGTTGILWLAFMQLAASGLGGYLAGRLRVKWALVHTDEVYFRDTAHGLLAWAVATLLTAAALGGAAHTVVAGAGRVAMTAAAVGAEQAPEQAREQAPGKPGPAASADPLDYYADRLLRAGATAPAQAPATDIGPERAEVKRILLLSLARQKLAPDDRDYLTQLVARRSGLDQAAAQSRTDETYASLEQAMTEAKDKAAQAAEASRKAASHTSLWMFVSLLLGAFVASLMATFGGRLRDNSHIQRR